VAVHHRLLLRSAPAHNNILIFPVKSFPPLISRHKFPAINFPPFSSNSKKIGSEKRACAQQCLDFSRHKIPALNFPPFSFRTATKQVPTWYFLALSARLSLS
jgi:hypothetical protein